MAKITSSCKFVWMVENFSKLDERRQESQVFCAGEHKWYQISLLLLLLSPSSLFYV